MSVQLTCPHCGSTATHRSDPMPGSQVRCPDCAEMFVFDDDGAGTRSGSDGRKRSKDGPNLGLILGLVGGGALLCVLLCGGGFYFAMRPAIERARQKAEEVRKANERKQQQVREQLEREQREIAARQAGRPATPPSTKGGSSGTGGPSGTKPKSKGPSSNDAPPKDPPTKDPAPMPVVPDPPPTRPAPPPKPSELEQALADLRSPDDPKRHWAAQKLLKLPVDESKRKEAAELLQKSLETGGTFAPSSAAAALASWGDASNVEPLAAVLRKSTDGNVKRAIVRTLVALDEAASVPVLIEELQSPDRSCRGDAMRALAKSQDPRGIGPIARWMPELSDRRTATEALVAYGPAAETETLKLLAHADRGVQDAAIGVLKEIGTPKAIPALRKAATANRSLERRASEAAAAIQARGR